MIIWAMYIGLLNRALSFKPENKEATRIRRKLEVGLDQVLSEEGAPPLELVQDDG